MTEKVKVALIIAGGAVVVTCLWLYFSPYQSCVRAKAAYGSSYETDPAKVKAGAKVFCAIRR
ncbi:MAG: hypothetical protein WC068_14960 [Caulobacter sp.]